MSTLNKTKFLTDKEAKELEKVCLARLDDIGACFILLAYYTGARTSEVLAVRQTDLVEGSVFIRGLKGSCDREIPLPKKFFDALKKLPGPELFNFHRNTAMRYWALYRSNQNRSLHSLRHTLALRLYKETKDIRLVKYVLGHKSIHNTMKYADYAYSQDELRRVIDGSFYREGKRSAV